MQIGFRLFCLLAIGSTLVAQNNFAAADQHDWTALNDLIENATLKTYMPPPDHTQKVKAARLEVDSAVATTFSALMNALPDLPRTSQGFIIGYIAEKKLVSAVPALIRTYDAAEGKEAPFLQYSIVTAVGGFAKPNNREFLLRALRNEKDSYVRRAAAEVLAKLPQDYETVLRLSEYLNRDSSAEVRAACARALGHFPSEISKRNLRDALR